MTDFMCIQTNTPVPTRPLLSSQRRKIWDLESRFHCSVVGTCLDLSELRRLGKKIGILKELLIDDYQLHLAFVNIISERSGEAKLVNKHIDRKFQKTINNLRKLKDSQSLAQQWRNAVKTGEIAATYWAIVTHPHSDDTLLQNAYGKVHMLSHLSGASIRVDMQQLIQLKQQLPTLEKQLKTQQQDIQKSSSAKRSMRLQLNQKQALQKHYEQQIAQLEARIQDLEQEHEIHELRDQNQRYQNQLAAAVARAEHAETGYQAEKALLTSHQQNYADMEMRFSQVSKEKDALEQALERMLSPDCSQCDNQESCSTTLDLCKRNILFVGGRNRQCAQFRALVERHNGHFIHHDGGLEESQQRLATLLARADVVLCPLDCVSHDAMHRIKKDCSRHGKPFQLLRQSSLAAFTRGLNDIAL